MDLWINNAGFTLLFLFGASRPLTGSPLGLPTFFFSPFSAAENGISGGQTQ